jgi:hypothetical protein
MLVKVIGFSIWPLSPIMYSCATWDKLSYIIEPQFVLCKLEIVGILFLDVS